MTRIAVIGEGVIDQFISNDTHRDVIGGSGLNTAVAMRRAGSDAIWFTRLANDPYGLALAQYAASEGVLDPNCTVGGEPASLVKVFLSEAGQPRYEFALDGAVDWQWAFEELEPLKSSFDIISIGSLSAVLEPGATRLFQTLKDLKNCDKSPLITYDPNARPTAASNPEHALEMKSRIQAMVEIADLVKVSDEDLAWLTPEVSASETAKKWSTQGPKLVVVTKGGEGAVAFADGEEIASVDGVRIEVVDTVGAGDTFMAWLVSQIANSYNCEIPLDKNSITSLLSQSAKAAAITCSREGCKPPFAEEIF